MTAPVRFAAWMSRRASADSNTPSCPNKCLNSSSEYGTKAVGFKWKDVDLDNMLISVRRKIIFVPGEGHLITHPKSQSSRRTVDISEVIASVMRRHRSKQTQHRIYWGSVWKDEGWVFTNPGGGHVNPNALSRVFKMLREELGLPPVRFHDLRHTHASILLRQGTHLKVVQERLGHSTIAITGDIYSHVVPGLQKAAARSFEDAMGEVEEAAGWDGWGHNGGNMLKRRSMV